MSTDTQLEQLETAILKQAQTQAQTHLQAGQQQNDRIVADSAKRLQQREQREIGIAKIAAEQEYRRQVQASEIKMQAELDQLRWSLVQAIITDLYKHLTQLCQQKTVYVELLQQYLQNAVTLFETDDLVVIVNSQDRAMLASQWDDITKNLKQPCSLATETATVTGGLLVRDQADRIRINNTFEGLIARQESQLYQVITAQLFASATPTRNM